VITITIICLGGAAVRRRTRDRKVAGRLPAGALSSKLGQLGLPSLRGRQIEYRPAWLGLGGERSLMSGGR